LSSSSTTTSSSVAPFPASSTYGVSEYYDAGSSNMVYFPSGQYSLLVGDIWGGYVILPFNVS
jgi:hypothetical protein